MNKITHILFIDDDADDYIMVRDMINAMPKGQFKLDWQADYNDALPIMQRQEHDVYIVDYVLGEKNGLQLIREAFPKGCSLPVILLTARGRREIDEEALSLGVTEYFDKADIRLPLLERAIRYAINNKRIEAELRQSEALFRSFVNSASDYIQVLDTEGVITRTNPATIRGGGYAESEIIGQPLSGFLTPPFKATFEKQFSDILKTGESRSEIEFLHKDGSIRYLDCSWSVVKNADKQYVVVIQRDVTERKRAEEKLQESLTREKELSELKSRFVSITSHELRTPLSTIQNNIYMLKNYAHKLDDASRDGKLDKIQLMVEHITELLQDVLSLNNIETGSSDFNPTLIQFDTFCRDIVEEFEHQKDQTHVLQFDYQQPIKATVDPRLMRQVISNLIDNSIKYSKLGTTVNLSLSQEENRIILKVTDQGIGIPPEDQEFMFHTFRRASNVGDVSGSGLGLSIVRQAVERHGGSISFTSTLGKGSTFVISLPAG
ncbi:MAG: PAS domain S-box protein [Chloroflexi bacterium]|nr:PAS domain S-box protein [Chloroflexota bacterium]MCC6894002.1 PAS domain S-box protein [Anaerolineae bacterium]